MKFTDMNFDCLETVLEYLELIDLLNVADSTKRLNKAAELVFAREYGKKEVRIERDTQISRDRLFKIRVGYISIYDLKTALQLLRCFGPVISEIYLGTMFETNVRNLPEIDPKIFTYINEYCADYLYKLDIYQIASEGSDLLNFFDRPFLRLKMFQSMDLVFTENICLNRLFPKMRSLSILHILEPTNTSFYNNNTKHFPYLEKLIIGVFGYAESFHRNEMVIKLLQLNPQLKDVKIRTKDETSIFNTDLIRSAVESLQNVENLSLLDLKPITFLDNSDHLIRMKSVKEFCISFDSLLFLPFSCENLVKFRITFPEPQFFNRAFIDQFFNFIDRHSSITDLTINTKIGRFDVVDWSRLAKSLPLLLAINIYGCHISADEAIEIMDKFKMLNKFWFRFSDDYDNFRKRLSKNWDGTYETGSKCVKLNRKI